ncbi:MAG TPA: tetratricopeptide repeat protein [Stellaceae bacterium]|nr:tetratricopeptide repeat protein [Stellaceae bacterium]
MTDLNAIPRAVLPDAIPPNAILPELAVGAVAAAGQPALAVTPPPDAPASIAQRITQLMQLATEAEQGGRLDEAEKTLRHVLSEAGDHHPALHLLAIVAFKQERPGEAVQLMERSVALAPMNAIYHRNLCEIYRVVGRLDDALVAGRHAATLAPNDVHCFHNLGVLHYHRLELAEAIACGERALRLDPNFPGGHFGIAEASLLRGDFARGWEEYEWRMKLGNAPPLLPPTDRPQWDGTPRADGTLLLIADQGYGDVIQFSRYIPWAAERCGTVALACSSELHPFVRQLPGVAKLFDHWEQVPEFFAYSALSSLPRLAGTDLATIPAWPSYAQADPVKVAYWRDRLDALLPASHRRLGIVWAGRPTHHNDRNRSTALASFAPLAALPGISLVSLQKGPAQSQIGSYWGHAPLVNLGPELRDFGDTMAVLDCLDSVITVDTSLGHLSGALGKAAWIMLPYAPDWRWLLHRTDTPWYPSLRLFRQGPERRWEPVMERITREIADTPAQRHS